jgi:exodeoxyribonuclease V alpha subunit
MLSAATAYQGIEEATGQPVTTIAAFLAAVAAGNVDPKAEWLLIVDEASMLDLPTLYRILRPMRPGQGLLLVGDPGQLPPIGFGLTFHAMAESDLIPRVELTEVHRQAASTGIPQTSRAIREGRLPDFLAFEGRGPGYPSSTQRRMPWVR